MIDVIALTNELLHKLNNTFGSRVWFVGLQGSYAREEATPTSDVDIVVILDEVLSSDVPIYRALLDTLPHRELICGFFSGKEELMNWEPSDLFQFYHDTTPILGSLDELLAVIDECTMERTIKIGACNIYHGCVHNMLHEKSEEILRGLYKTASFVVRASVFKQTGRYIASQKELLQGASADEREILRTFIDLKNGKTVEFEEMSALLFDWSKKQIKNTKRYR